MFRSFWRHGTGHQGVGYPPVPSQASPMLLRLRKNASPRERDAVLAAARELGYAPRFLDRDELLLELSLSPERPGGAAADRSVLGDLSAVAAVLDAGEAPELVERTAGRPDTAVRVGDACFGAGKLSVIAGPCAVEGEERLMEIARAVRDAGATLLRGGAFKPRSSPYSFQGLGEEGLARLARVKAEVGLGVVTEVLDPRDLEPVLAVADMLQIGSRSMSNGVLLTEAGRSGKPVLLKRGLAATAREFLLAAEYVLAAGNAEVVLCERGIRGFDAATRNVLDLGTVAYLRSVSHLPVIVDPSHAAGRPDLVLPLARAAVAAGADGLIIEVHPEPSEARSDGAQAIAPDALRAVVDGADELCRLDGRTLQRPRGPERPGNPDPSYALAT